MVSAETTGTIKFNNEQRVFAPEDGTNSIFTKSTNRNKTKNANSPIENDNRFKIRLGFNSSNELHRQLLLTIDPKTSLGYDWGYDAPFNDNQKDDMYWIIENDKYVIQGIDKIDNETIIPLGIKIKNNGLNTITIDKIENETSNINIYLHDKELNIYHDLKETNYQVYLTSGEYLDRFEITFKNSQSSLTTTDIEENLLNIYYSNEKTSIILMNSNLKPIDSAELFNILGQ